MFGLNLIFLIRFRLIVSRKKPFGVHPETWVVASKFTTLVDEKFERPSSYFGTSVPSLHEADYKGTSFGHFPTLTYLQFVLKMTPVHGILGPGSDRT